MFSSLSVATHNALTIEKKIDRFLILYTYYVN